MGKEISRLIKLDNNLIISDQKKVDKYKAKDNSTCVWHTGIDDLPENYNVMSKNQKWDAQNSVFQKEVIAKTYMARTMREADFEGYTPKQEYEQKQNNKTFNAKTFSDVQKNFLLNNQFKKVDVINKETNQKTTGFIKQENPDNKITKE